MFKRFSPAGIAPPASPYVHAVTVTGASRWLHISGQIGVMPDGAVAGDSEAQMDLCWQRILTVLDEAGMRRENLVKVSAFLTRSEDVPLYRQVRDRHLQGVETASTLLVVAALAHPEWTVEIEAIAAG